VDGIIFLIDYPPWVFDTIRIGDVYNFLDHERIWHWKNQRTQVQLNRLSLRVGFDWLLSPRDGHLDSTSSSCRTGRNNGTSHVLVGTYQTDRHECIDSISHDVTSVTVIIDSDDRIRKRGDPNHAAIEVVISINGGTVVVCTTIPIPNNR